MAISILFVGNKDEEKDRYLILLNKRGINIDFLSDYTKIKDYIFNQTYQLIIIKILNSENKNILELFYSDPLVARIPKLLLTDSTDFKMKRDIPILTYPINIEIFTLKIRDLISSEIYIKDIPVEKLFILLRLLKKTGKITLRGKKNKTICIYFFEGIPLVFYSNLERSFIFPDLPALSELLEDSKRNMLPLRDEMKSIFQFTPSITDFELKVDVLLNKIFNLKKFSYKFEEVVPKQKLSIISEGYNPLKYLKDKKNITAKKLKNKKYQLAFVDNKIIFDSLEKKNSGAASLYMFFQSKYESNGLINHKKLFPKNFQLLYNLGLIYPIATRSGDNIVSPETREYFLPWLKGETNKYLVISFFIAIPLIIIISAVFVYNALKLEPAKNKKTVAVKINLEEIKVTPPLLKKFTTLFYSQNDMVSVFREFDLFFKNGLGDKEERKNIYLMAVFMAIETGYFKEAIYFKELFYSEFGNNLENQLLDAAINAETIRISDQNDKTALKKKVREQINNLDRDFKKKYNREIRSIEKLLNGGF